MEVQWMVRVSCGEAKLLVAKNEDSWGVYEGVRRFRLQPLRIEGKPLKTFPTREEAVAYRDGLIDLFWSVLAELTEEAEEALSRGPRIEKKWMTISE